MKTKLSINKVKIANLNQESIENVKGGGTVSLVSTYISAHVIDSLSTAAFWDGSCWDTFNPTDTCPPESEYSCAYNCTVSVCDNI